MSTLDLSQFPFTHTRVFSRIVESLDSASLLTCRNVCHTWLRWIKSSKVWTQVMPIRLALARKKAREDTIVNNRLDRIELMPRESEAECRALAIKVDRVSGETVPEVSEETRMIVERLQKAWKEGAIENPVFGPMMAFVRVKVNHWAIGQIIKETFARFLNSILVDKKDMEKGLMRKCVMQAMYLGQNWTHVNFSRKRGVREEFDRGLTGEMSLEEALKESLKSHEPKKRDREEEDGTKEIIEPKLKRSRLEDECDLEESNEDLNEEIEPILRSHPKFPTLLELLDFDDPIIEEVLVQRLQIHKVLTIPQFEQFLHQPDLFETSFTIQGLDSDGKVSQVEPGQFSDKEAAVVGYVDNPSYVHRFTTEQVLFWGGRDIRRHWPEFSRQLDAMDLKEKEDSLKMERSKKCCGDDLVKTTRHVLRKTGGTGWAHQGHNTISFEVAATERSPGTSQMDGPVVSRPGNEVAKIDNSAGTSQKDDYMISRAGSSKLDDVGTPSVQNTQEKSRKQGDVATIQAGTGDKGECSSKACISGASYACRSETCDNKPTDYAAILLARGVIMSNTPKK